MENIQKTQIKLLEVKIMSEILKYTDWINSGLDSREYENETAFRAVTI